MTDPLHYQLDLPENRVTLGFNKLRLVHVFSRATLEDHFSYQQKIISKITTDGIDIQREIDTVDADRDLWSRLILRVENYKSIRLGDLSDLEDWKDRIPVAHRLAAVRAIYKTEIDFDFEEGEFFDSGLAVALKDVQNGRQIKSLVHRFRDPETSDIKEWSRLSNLSDKRRTRRGQIVSTPRPRLRGEIALYDKLIVDGLEGYLNAGQPIATARDAVAYMDAIHKSHAINEYFRRLDEGAELPESEEDKADPLA